MKTDIEISNECNMLNIKEVAKKINVDENTSVHAEGGVDAIESVVKVEDKEKRLIHLVVSKVKSNVATATSQLSNLYKKIEDFAVATDSLDEMHENKEQIELAKFYEQLPKPYLIAIKEYNDNNLVYKK